MPTLHRLSCFRDDLIFLVYLYQRWIYPVDTSRINEFGQRGDGKSPEDVAREEAEAAQQTAKAKVEAKAEAKVEAKAEAKVEAKAEAKSEAKAEAIVEAEAEAKVEAKAEAKVEAEAEAKAEPKPKAKAEGVRQRPSQAKGPRREE